MLHKRYSRVPGEAEEPAPAAPDGPTAPEAESRKSRTRHGPTLVKDAQPTPEGDATG